MKKRIVVLKTNNNKKSQRRDSYRNYLNNKIGNSKGKKKNRKNIMEVFSNPHYYPSPSSDVILYNDQPVTKSRRSVSQADIYALLVYLTSPVDPVSYPIFSDFFLVYREFISSIKLYDLLIKRFQWCISEINSKDKERSKIGNIALVRTFVFIRHGILNHFIEDFLPNTELRLLFLEFLNKSYSNENKIIKDCVVNLKKIWIHCMKSTWDNIELNEPDNISFENKNNTISNYENLNNVWLNFQIKDISQLNKEIKRNSRLSVSALQGLSNPNYRNQSVMSLYKNNENFQLNIFSENKNNKKLSRHTPSMLLTPNNSFNYATRISLDRISKISNKYINNINPTTVTEKLKNNNSTERPVKRKVGIISRLPSNMSSIISDLEYPRNSKIDKIIPPTPAKKIELILNTKYVPEEEISSTIEINESDISSNKNSVNVNSRSQYNYNCTGPMGLLNKWKKNHLRNKRHEMTSLFKKNSKQKNNSEIMNMVKPQMDTFIKYVISISSLENHNQNSNEVINLDSSKFDILSARTIDEVEYLLNLENNLIEKINKLNNDGLSITKTEETIENEHEDYVDDVRDLKLPINNFSAMDNLDMYQTINSIAQSVISLSNTLNMPKNNNNNSNTSETVLSDSRRRIKSSTAALLRQSNNSSRYTLKNQNFNDINLETSPLYIGGPQKLIFRTSSHDRSSISNFSNSNIVSLTPTKLSRSPRRNRSSPLFKKLSEDFEEAESKRGGIEDIKSPHKVMYETSNEMIGTEYISYDSDLPISDDNINKQHMESKFEYTTGHDLKKKNSFDNLRESTLEESTENRDLFKNGKSLVDFSQLINDGLDEITDLYGTSNMNKSSSVLVTSKSPQVGDFKNSATNSNGRLQFYPIENSRNSVTVADIRPACGRTSLIKKNIEQLNRRKTTATAMSLVNTNIKSTKFFQRDKMPPEGEEKLKTLEINPSQRELASLDTTTTTLFTSIHSSPRKGSQVGTQMENSVNSRVCLSVQPSIQSIISDGTFSSYSTFESKPSKMVDLRTKFQEGQGIDTGSTFETTGTNKYIYEPISESLEDVSPMKNIEVLRNKFLKKENTKSPNNMGARQPSDVRTSPHEYISQSINGEALKNIADITDDTIQGNPLEVAMMKLEGTYTKTKDKLDTTESSSEILKLSKEVEMLNVTPIVNVPNIPQEKRRSLLVQRRRQTLMNIPYTPPFDKKGEPIEPFLQNMGSIKPEDIQKLLAEYEIRDPNLLVSNNENHIPFILTYDSLSIARQMTLIEKELLNEIDWKDLLDLNTRCNGLTVTSWLQLLVQNENLSGIDLAIARFNLTVDWVISEIAITKDTKLKRNTIQKFIHVAEHCREFQNYNTLMQIVLALNSVVVQRFIEAWRLIEPGDMLTWEELKKIPSLDRNYYIIRTLLNNVDPLKGCVPFIAVYLSDLSLNAQKKTWIEHNKIINYNKFDTSVQIVKHFIQRVQWSKNYQFEVDHELLSKCIYLTALPQDELQQLISQYE